MIIAQNQCCCARKAARAAPAPLGPLCTTARTQRFSLSRRTSHAAVPTARGGLAAHTAPFSSSGFPPFLLGRPFFLPTYFALRRAPRPPVCTHARSRKHERPTNERRDVRSADVADWITARRGNTGRTLTAAAGPSPCDPYRHALKMRPPPKAQPISFLNYWKSLQKKCPALVLPAPSGPRAQKKAQTTAPVRGGGRGMSVGARGVLQTALMGLITALRQQNRPKWTSRAVSRGGFFATTQTQTTAFLTLG